MRVALDGWGASETYARLMKERKVAKARKIRAAAKPFIPEPTPVEVFRTASGQLAYRKFMPNRDHLGVLMTTKAEGTSVSLPWVSILR